MADTKTKAKTKAEEVTEPDKTAATSVADPKPRPAGVATAGLARPRIGSDTKRLSKGQRKHVRRQKQAGEIKVTARR